MAVLGCGAVKVWTTIGALIWAMHRECRASLEWSSSQVMTSTSLPWV